MNRALFSWLFVALSLLMAGFVFGATFGSSRAKANDPPLERVALRYDQVEGALHVLIDGITVAHFSKNGLQVSGDIAFSGYLVDTGQSGDAEAE